MSSSTAQVIEIASVGTGTATMHAVRWLPGTARFFAAGADARGAAALRAYALGGGQGGGDDDDDEQTRAPSAAAPSSTDVAPRLTLDCTPASLDDWSRPCAGLRCASFFSVGGRSALAAGALDGALLVFDPERPARPAWASSAPAALTAAPSGGGGGGGSSEGGPCPAAPGAISALDAIASPGPPEIATGGLDGAVRVWDVRQRAAPVATFEPCFGGGGGGSGGTDGSGQPRTKKSRECWAVAFGGATSGEDRLVAAGYDNGDVKVFDLRMASSALAAAAGGSGGGGGGGGGGGAPAALLRCDLNVGNGVCSLAFDRRDIEPNKLLVGCLEGVMAAVDLRARGGKAGGKARGKAAAAAGAAATNPRPLRAILPPAQGIASALVAERQKQQQRQKQQSRGGTKDLAALAAAGGQEGDEEEEDARAAADGDSGRGRPRRGSATAWVVAPLPQDREVSACTTGDGAVVLHRYRYGAGAGDDDDDCEEEEGRGGRGLSIVGGAALAPQPLSAWDWSPDKRGLFVCGALDQRLRVGVVTGLHNL